MRKFLLLALMASLTWTVAGCGDSTPAPAGDEGPKAPGVPTDGPEVPKAPKAKKG
ncbi:hypothetical protein [Paludisphaera mucosa]|uniref:Uncharacterized protein n=1 Tax=Paludisphaera mucosa TaxID=3030827 RepID=A0ABT6FAP0_9BACT|nr:hypothetical protein [Paludisphaera mucosa]MDG3004658.1 hypothetical protein [Paludisphaera mucosa]